MFEQVCAALDKTHAAGIVHRDLKPENLFVTRRDDGSIRMKILDFGIAKVVDGKTGSTKAVGTPLYMAPEQITGQARATRSETDFYAMAHIAFTVLVGRAYFEAEAERSDGLMGLMWQVHSGPTEAATARARYFGVELPPAFDAWFARGTAKDPDARFHSGAELVAGLRAALEGGDAAVVAASLPSGAVVVVPHGPPPSEPSSLVTGATAQVALTGEVPTSTTVPSTELPRSRAGLGVVAAGALAIASIGAFLALRGGEVVATSAPSESGSAPAVTGPAGGVEPPASSLAIVPAPAASSLASAFTPASSAPVASAPVVGGPQSTPGSRTGPRSNGATPPPSSTLPPIPTSKSTAAPAPTSLEWDGGR
jgi:serine/threonine-protein kinase